jgi:homoserine O-acetyltransferase
MTQGALGLGRTETRRVVLFTADDPLVLESGSTLGPVEVAYETYGELAPDGGNAVFVCHARTGDAHAAGDDGDSGRRGWWDTLIGPGRPLDTDRLFVICPNLLGGCNGTTGPSSIDPASAGAQRAYGLRFPQFTVRDLVRDFPQDDKLYRLVKRAHDAVHELFLETHEMGCKGVGRGPR